MASSSYLYCSLHRNPPPANPSNNELVESLSRVFTKSSSSPASSSFAFTLKTALFPSPTPAPKITFSRYIDKDLQRAIKLALKSFFQGQEHAQNQARINQDNGPQERLFKAHFSKLYDSNSHLVCYKFC